MKKGFMLLWVSFVFIASIHIAADSSTKPLVSLITIVNENDPLTAYLEDVTQQQFFQKSELIFVSSSPNLTSEATAKIYQQSFSNIFYHCFPACKSESALLNTAIKTARGTCIAFLRIEDHWDNDAFERLLSELLGNNEIDIAYSHAMLSPKKNSVSLKSDNWYPIIQPNFHLSLLYQNIIGTHCIWRISLHDQAGYFLEHFRYEYWLEFWNRCALHGAIFKRVPCLAGKHYFSYRESKKIDLDINEVGQAYQEYIYIRNKYSSLWEVEYNLEQKPFVIIIPSYQNKDWYQRNIDSVINQNYHNYRIIYIDDNSPDSTGLLVTEYIKSVHKAHKITVIINKERVGALANTYRMAHMCQPHEIIVVVDGDDFLSDDNVLNRLNSAYQDPEIWLTYGQFRWFPQAVIGFATPLPKQVLEEGKVREKPWVATHLRSFYAGLFHHIDKKDLLYQEKEFYPTAGDLAIMFPLIEMAGMHIKCISDIMYCYNIANALNDHKINEELQRAVNKELRSKQHYQPLEHW